MPLTNTQLQTYHRDGFVVVRGLCTGEELARLGREVDGLHERMASDAPSGVGIAWEELPADHPPRIRQLMNSEAVCPTIDALSRGEAIGTIMEQLIGPELVLFHSKLMMKAARDGTFTPWHQDWSYWQNGSREPSQVNGMLAIDPATVENGCIRFVPGSHRRGPIEHVRLESSSFNIGLPGDLDAYPDAVPVELAAGDAVFFGPLVIHGSGPNESDHDRRANTFAFDRLGNALRGEPSPDRLRLRPGTAGD